MVKLPRPVVEVMVAVTAVVVDILAAVDILMLADIQPVVASRTDMDE